MKKFLVVFAILVLLIGCSSDQTSTTEYPTPSVSVIGTVDSSGHTTLRTVTNGSERVVIDSTLEDYPFLQGAIISFVREYPYENLSLDSDLNLIPCVDNGNGNVSFLTEADKSYNLTVLFCIKNLEEMFTVCLGHTEYESSGQDEIQIDFYYYTGGKDYLYFETGEYIWADTEYHDVPGVSITTIINGQSKDYMYIPMLDPADPENEGVPQAIEYATAWTTWHVDTDYAFYDINGTFN